MRRSALQKIKRDHYKSTKATYAPKTHSKGTAVGRGRNQENAGAELVP